MICKEAGIDEHAKRAPYEMRHTYASLGSDSVITAEEVAQQLGITAHNFSLGGNAGSDHESFQRVGIDTVFFSRDYSLLHTPQDEISQVRQEYLGEAGRVALELAKELDQKSE